MSVGGQIRSFRDHASSKPGIRIQTTQRISRRRRMHQKKPMFSAKFQTFDDIANPAASSSRLAGLRFNLKWDGVDGFILPRADRFQNEYVPPSEERLTWLTGFTGSAGIAIVLADRAALFVDGRYTLQAKDQVDASVFTIVPIAETSPEKWIEK